MKIIYKQTAINQILAGICLSFLVSFLILIIAPKYFYEITFFIVIFGFSILFVMKFLKSMKN